MRKDIVLNKRSERRAAGAPRLACHVGAGLKHRRSTKYLRNTRGTGHSRAGTILVPIDFTDVSHKALDYALWMATKLHCSVALLHVVQRNYAEGFVDAKQRVQTRGKTRRDARMKLNGLASQKCIADIPMKCVVRDGLPEYEILKAAQDLKPELLILGRPNRNPLSRLIFDSVTADVIDAAPCPVLVISNSGIVRRSAEHCRLLTTNRGGGFSAAHRSPEQTTSGRDSSGPLRVRRITH